MSQYAFQTIQLLRHRDCVCAATKLGSELMALPLGELKAKMHAGMLLVDDDPTRDITALRDKTKLLAVMKGGTFHTMNPRLSEQTPSPRR